MSEKIIEPKIKLSQVLEKEISQSWGRADLRASEVNSGGDSLLVHDRATLNSQGSNSMEPDELPFLPTVVDRG